MAKQVIELGGVVKSEVKKINDNFTELYDAETSGNKSNDLSDYNNDAGFITSTDIPSVPDKVSDLTNDAGYQTAEQVTQTVSAAVGNKVDKVTGKDLSTNDYTNADKATVSKIGMIQFSASEFGALQTDGYCYATIAAAGRQPVKVFKSNGGNYEEVLAQVNVNGDNIVICSCAAFSGYVLTI